MDERCLLCTAERLTEWHVDDADCWIADCVVCMTPMVVWRIHGIPDPALERELLGRLERVAAGRYGEGGFSIDLERRRIPDHWHAHARPVGGFFDPRSELYGVELSTPAVGSDPTPSSSSGGDPSAPAGPEPS